MRKRIVTIILLLIFHASISEACRFWVATGNRIDQKYVIDQLIKEPYSLKKLGDKYADGWSVGFYNEGDEVVIRGDEASSFNHEFDDAVRYIAILEPDIVMGHLRRASSGCVEGVPNPHPFRIKYNNKNWLFGHNGGMKKQILIDLIGEDFLKAHPPNVCNHDPPNSWIDSELYFLLIMKTIKEHDDDIEAGISSALRKIYTIIDEEHRYLNFFMSDGHFVWVYRKGNSLFYRFDPEQKLTVVSSTVPSSTEGDWKEFPEDTLAVLAPRQFPQFILLK